MAREPGKAKFALILLGFLAGTTHATVSVPPTLDEVVAGADHIGLATIVSAEDYHETDSEGDIWCGVVYRARWAGSLTGESGSVTFVSKQLLEIRGRYLLFLAGDQLPRKLASTNSWSERERAHQLGRESKCRRTQDTPQTVFRASKFVDESHVAESYKTGIWVESPRFLGNDLREIIIMPMSISIDGEVISRDQFLTEFYDEYKHQVVRTAGYEMIIFRAVDWKEYCSALEHAFRAKHPDVASELMDPAFCDL